MTRQSSAHRVHLRGGGLLLSAFIAAAGLAAAPANAQHGRGGGGGGPGGSWSGNPAGGGGGARPAVSAPQMSAPRMEAPSRPSAPPMVMHDTPRMSAPSAPSVIRSAPRPVITQAPGSPPVVGAPRSPIGLPPPRSAAPASPRVTPFASAPHQDPRPPVLLTPPSGHSAPPVFGSNVSKPSPTYTAPRHFTIANQPTGFSTPRGNAPGTRPPVITKAPDHTTHPAADRPRTVWTAAKPASSIPATRTAAGPAVPHQTPIVSSAAPANLVPVGGSSNPGRGPTTSAFVGVGVGTTAGGWHTLPAPTFNGCFAPIHSCFADPFCHAPGFHDCFWAHDHWGGCYPRCWGYWPSWWWYPSFYACAYPCGTFCHVSYCHGPCDWGLSFGFGFNAAWGYNSCGLISPSVYATYAPEPVSPVYTVLGSGSTVSVIEPSATQDTTVASAAPLPAPANSDQLRASSDRELADVYMRLGDAANAVRVYNDHIARFPGDVDAVRALGIAMLESDRAAEGAEQIERAYLMDQTLAQRPLPRDLLGDPDRLARALDSATRQAAHDNSGRSWLAVAVVMQADGRSGPAHSALEKARSAGLYSRIVDGMQSALPAGQQ